MDNPLISIIIPAFNAEKYIGRAIASALRQTYNNIEVVVVNDGSTDQTEKLVSDICAVEKRVRLISTPNFGVSHARNIGVDGSKGEYFSFLDADDELLDDGIMKMFTCITAHDADICVAEYIYTTDGQSTGKADKDTKVSVIQGKDAIMYVVEDRPETYSSCAKLYRKKAIHNIRFPEGRSSHEDAYFVFLLLLNNASMAILNQAVYKYYFIPNSLSRSAVTDRVFDMIYLSEEKTRLICEKYPDLEEKAKNVLIKAHMALLGNLSSTTDKKYRNSEKESIRFIIKNKKSFVPATSWDEKWFFIITHRLYYLYKVYRTRFRLG